MSLLTTIAQSVGYGSESAFGLAFKKVMGCSPRQYGRGRSPNSPLQSTGQTVGIGRLEHVAG
jgi:AraC-like DNA-binding protein